MTADHPAPADLELYLRGELPAEAARAIERHLARCALCQAALEAATEPSPSPVLWRAGRFRPGAEAPSESPATPPAGANPDSGSGAERIPPEAIDEFLGDLGHALAGKGRAALAELLAVSEHERRRLLRAEPERLASEDLAVRLLARCRAAWAVDPGQAVEHAKLALLVVQRLDPAVWRPERVEHLRELALQHLSWSNWIARRAGEIERQRAASSLGEGWAREEEGFAVAEDALAVEVEAALDDLLEACLARDRGYDAALAVFDRARLALARGGREGLRDLAESEGARFEALDLPVKAREAVRWLRHRVEEGEPDLPGLLDKLARIVLSARNDFAE